MRMIMAVHQVNIRADFDTILTTVDIKKKFLKFSFYVQILIFP